MRLQAVKQAVREVSQEIQDEINAMRDNAKADDIDDKFGWTMRCLRAIEKNHSGTVHRATNAYPTLKKR